MSRDAPRSPGHNVAVREMAPQSDPSPAAANSLQMFEQLGWIDLTALAVILVFFVLGLWKGIVWQVSRVVILIAAYGVSARFGEGLGAALLRWTHVGPAPATDDQQLTAFYIGCVLVFVSVLVGLSLLALLLQKLVKSAGLGFYDRLFGGVLGVGSGAIVVLLLLTAVHMFSRQSPVAEAASTSHALRLSQQVVDAFGGVLPEELRSVLRPAGFVPATATSTDLQLLPIDGVASPAAPGEAVPAVSPAGSPVSPKKER